MLLIHVFLPTVHLPSALICQSTIGPNNIELKCMYFYLLAYASVASMVGFPNAGDSTADNNSTAVVLTSVYTPWKIN